MLTMDFSTEVKFTLPRGYVDENNTVHREGTMRCATAADEILPMKDPRVQQNPGYLSIILLARVITRLGDLTTVDTRVIERLFTADLAYLQDLYQSLNAVEPLKIPAVCPACGKEFTVEAASPGEA